MFLYWFFDVLNVLCSEIKERIKKTKDEKKSKKAEVMSKSQKSQAKGSIAKGAAPKGPKLGGGGGKR
jgi:large subunit ribosomal protein L24e